MTRTRLPKYGQVLVVWLLAGLLIACTTGDRYPMLKSAPPAPYPQTAFAVFSDPHLYDPGLGTDGEAFQAYLDRDRKLLVESGELLDTVVDAVIAAPVQFVLVCGDLTKDGEASGHRIVADKLRRIRRSGKDVLVVPGNHDVMNGAAVRYAGKDTVPVPTVTAAQFADIYADFGYGAALDRDAASLSYVSEPVDGLWVLALDSCRHRDKRPGRDPVTGGAYSRETIAWIGATLEKAQLAKKAVIVFQHHGILKHYPGNEKHYPEYIVDNHEAMVELLSRGGVSLVFSGHFHAQDITQRVFPDGRVLYDIETGSTVTAPCPYRIVSISAARQATINSRFITRIPSRPEGFDDYAEAYTFSGTVKLADTALKKYGVRQSDRDVINPQIAAAYLSHLKGDEPPPASVVDVSGVGWWGRMIVAFQGDLLEGWSTDLPPSDNNVVLDLGTR
jgi:3',5'-cyclic AMP phosphodiesterase CpdA